MILIFHMLNFDKSFIYDHTTTAISSCDESLIKEIIKHAEKVKDTCSISSIRLTILTIFNSIHKNNKRFEDLITDIKNIIETKKDNNILQQKYDEMCNSIYRIGEVIIYSSIFIMIVSKKHDTLQKYPRRLYEYIHDFKLALYHLNLHFRYDWDNDMFEEEHDIHRYRLNMFVFRSCGLKNQAIFNPSVDINTEYINYMEDLIDDINRLK